MTYQELIDLATQIRDNSTAASNTAELVGSTVLSVIQYFQVRSGTAAIEAEVQQALELIDQAGTTATGSINTAKEDALDAIDEAIEGLEVHYDIETDKGAVKDVQLKDGQGNKLMPKTNAEVVDSYTETLYAKLGKQGTTSGYVSFNKQFFPLGVNQLYKIVINTDTPLPVNIKIGLLAGYTYGGDIHTMRSGSTSDVFTFINDQENIDGIQIQAKRDIYWDVELYLINNSSVNTRVYELENNLLATKLLPSLVKDTINLCSAEGLMIDYYRDNNYQLQYNNLFETITIPLDSNTTYSVYRNGILGKTRLFDNDRTSIFGENTDNEFSFTTGDNGPYQLFVTCQKSSGDYTKKVMVIKGTQKPSIFIPWYNLFGSDYYKKLDELDKSINTTFYQKGLILNKNTTKIKSLLCYDKNIYHTLVGSSSSAWQRSDFLAPEGVCQVPPTCDRQGLAYGLWSNSVFGSPQYRRYDYGKKSLVGSFSDSWVDDTNAFFNELGNWEASYGNFSERADTRTTLDTSVSSIPFDSNANQRHIPRRYSNDANSQVSFIIPAGYKRFAFIHDINVLGDTITITTDRSEGIVKYSQNPNMQNSIEANGASFSTLFNGSPSLIGYPNIMEHFEILDTSVPTTITMTKTSDTNKYFIYWGVVYYSTAVQPYAHIFSNNALGGANAATINTNKWGMIEALHPNLVSFQLTITNSINADNPNFTNGLNDIISSINNISNYCTALDSEINFIIQHKTKKQARGNLSIINDIFNGIRRYLQDNNHIVLGDIARLAEMIHKCYYSNLSYLQFISLISMDDVHLNTDGLSIYNALFS